MSVYFEVTNKQEFLAALNYGVSKGICGPVNQKSWGRFLKTSIPLYIFISDKAVRWGRSSSITKGDRRLHFIDIYLEEL